MQVTGLRTRPCAPDWHPGPIAVVRIIYTVRRRVLLDLLPSGVLEGRRIGVITPKTRCLSWTGLASGVSKHKWNAPKT